MLNILGRVHTEEHYEIARYLSLNMLSKKPAGSSTKRTLEEECPICEDKIKEAVGSQVGQDSIWCDGLCVNLGCIGGVLVLPKVLSVCLPILLPSSTSPSVAYTIMKPMLSGFSQL